MIAWLHLYEDPSCKLELHNLQHRKHDPEDNGYAIVTAFQQQNLRFQDNILFFLGITKLKLVS